VKDIPTQGRYILKFPLPVAHQQERFAIMSGRLG
jgi:hypothetical protein